MHQTFGKWEYAKPLKDKERNIISKCIRGYAIETPEIAKYNSYYLFTFL